MRHQLQAQEQLQALQKEGLQHQLLTLQQQVCLTHAADWAHCRRIRAENYDCIAASIALC